MINPLQLTQKQLQNHPKPIREIFTMTEQLELPSLEDPKKHTIPVHVWKSIDHKGVTLYHATIAEGWWYATSTSSDVVIKAVVRRYEQETGKML